MDVVVLVALGLVAGIVSVVFGVGGGIIVVPALMWVKGLDIKVAVGTSLAFIIPTAILGALRKPAAEVDWRLAAIVAAGAIGGVFVGVAIGDTLDGVWIKRGFAGLLILVAVKMLFFD